MSLYFGDFIKTVTSLLLITALMFIGHSAVKHKNIEQWGRRTVFLALWGLVICCFAAVRDGYHLSVQASFDSSVEAGIFAIDSIESTLCCIGGAVIGFAGVSCIFVKNQKYRKIMFFLLSGAMICKVFIIELSRICR